MMSAWLHTLGEMSKLGVLAPIGVALLLIAFIPMICVKIIFSIIEFIELRRLSGETHTVDTHGYPVELNGVWTCSCGCAYEGHVWITPCPACGEIQEAIVSPTGLTVLNPTRESRR
jgi:hypothetical protein